MSKLNVSNANKGISFVSLDINNTILTNSIIIDNNKFKINGDMNLSINSKNSIIDYKKTTNSFEFSNNDNINFEKCEIIKKSLEFSDNIISILNKGLKVSNTNSLISINSKNNTINDSEIISTINLKDSSIDSSDYIYSFGNNNSITKSSKSIIIGNSINTNSSKCLVIIAQNVNTNNNNQLLFGNFKGINSKDVSIGIANKENLLGTNKIDDKINISRNLTINRGIINSKNENYNSLLNIVLNPKSNIKDIKAENNIVLSEGLINSSSNDISFGNNYISNSIYSIILGNDNKCTYTNYSFILGNENTLYSVNYTIIFGLNNSNVSSSNNLTYGNSNTISNASNLLVGGYKNKIGLSNYLIINGNNHNINTNKCSIVIGNSFTSNFSKDSNYSYVISDGKETLILNQNCLYIGKNEKVSYEKYIRDAKNFIEYYSKFKYSLISQKDVYVFINDNFEKCKYLKLHKDGFCNISYKSHSPYENEYLLKVFVKGEKVVSCLFKNEIIEQNSYNNIVSYYKDGDIYYIKLNVFVNAYILKSSKCEIIDEIEGKTLINSEIVGPKYLNYKALNDKIDSNTLSIKTYTTNKQNDIESIVCKTLDTGNCYYIDNSYFKKIFDVVPEYTYYVKYAKIGEFLCSNDISNYYREIFGTNYTLGYNINMSGFKYTFYSTEPILIDGTKCIFETLPHTNFTIPYIKFVRRNNKKVYNYSSLQRISQLCNRIDNNENIILLNNGTSNDEIKKYLSNGSRFRSEKEKKINDKIFSDASGFNECAYDTIIRLCDENAQPLNTNMNCIDFISNFNSTYILKWGIFANVSFDTLQVCANSIPDKQLLFYTRMNITGKANNYYDKPDSVKISGTNIEMVKGWSNSNYGYLERYYNDYDKDRVFTYTQKIYTDSNEDYFIEQNKPYIIPFASLVSPQNRYLFKSKNNVYDVINSLRPKSNHLNFIKTINVFNTPINMHIHYNNGVIEYIRNSVLHQNTPLFYGELYLYKNFIRNSENKGNFFNAPTSKVMDATTSNLIRNNKGYFECGNNFRYFDFTSSIFPDSGNHILKSTRAGEINSRVTITYMLDSL